MLMLPPIRREFPSPLIRYRLRCPINSDKPNTNRISCSTALKLFYLVSKISNDTVNLLNHRFCEYLCLSSNLNVCDRAAGDEHSLRDYGDRRRNKLSKSSIAAPRSFANYNISRVHHRPMMLDSV